MSNDDGIYSEGIYELVSELKKIGDVTVVAPLTEQSAAGHSVTMKTPLRVTEYFRNGEFFGYAVNGTPADTVKIGIKNIIKEIPDIVVSGINHGSNTAINIIYSGTVSAAREAAIMDIPAIAVSVTSHDAIYFNPAAKTAAYFAQVIAEKGLPKGTLLNINVPNLPEEKINGIKITKQGKSKWDDGYTERKDPYNKSYFWLTGSLLELDEDEDADQLAVSKNFISVSPIHFDLTDYKTLEEIKSWSINTNIFK